MATTMPWGETVEVRMELGFPVLPFTLGSATLGTLGGASYLGGTLQGLDVSPYVMSLTTNRGRPDQLSQFTAGTASIELNNSDRRFDPINEASPYWDATAGRSGVVPRRKVSIFCDGQPIFVGRITDIDIQYTPSSPTNTTENSTVTITASDDFARLANTYTDAAIVPTEEFSGLRVTSILDLAEVSYPAADRQIAQGVAVLGGGATFTIDANTNALSYLQQINDAEQGYLFIAADGVLVFAERILPAFPVIAAQFNDDGTQLPYSGLDVIYGAEFLYNRVQTSAVGGTEQIADDAQSQSEFGIITLALTDLLLKDDAAALTLADVLLDRYAQPEYRFDRLRTIYNGQDATNRADLTALEIADIVQVSRTFNVGTPSSVTREFSIEGVQHAISAQSHTVTFALAVATLLDQFVLGDPEFGTLGTTNALA